MVYRIFEEQALPISVEKAWEFFSSPYNLAKITPDKLGFKIIGDPSPEIYQGQIIEYRVKPLLGIPLQWITEISSVDSLKSFVDEQKSGPYKLWHHQHIFEAAPEGVKMTDIVHYKLPLGIMGRVAHAAFVKQQLRTIFSHRRAVLEEHFRSETKVD